MTADTVKVDSGADGFDNDDADVADVSRSSEIERRLWSDDGK